MNIGLGQSKRPQEIPAVFWFDHLSFDAVFFLGLADGLQDLLLIAIFPEGTHIGIATHQSVSGFFQSVSPAAAATFVTVITGSTVRILLQQVLDATIYKMHVIAAAEAVLQANILNFGEPCLFRAVGHGHTGQKPSVRRNVAGPADCTAQIAI